jgi:hypothetical protein
MLLQSVSQALSRNALQILFFQQQLLLGELASNYTYQSANIPLA